MGTATVQPDPTTAYRQPVEDIVAALATGARRGLGQEEVRAPGWNPTAGTS